MNLGRTTGYLRPHVDHRRVVLNNLLTHIAAFRAVLHNLGDFLWNTRCDESWMGRKRSSKLDGLPCDDLQLLCRQCRRVCQVLLSSQVALFGSLLPEHLAAKVRLAETNEDGFHVLVEEFSVRDVKIPPESGLLFVVAHLKDTTPKVDVRIKEGSFLEA